MMDQFQEEDNALQMRVEEVANSFKKLFTDQVEPLKSCIRDYDQRIQDLRKNNSMQTQAILQYFPKLRKLDLVGVRTNRASSMNELIDT